MAQLSIITQGWVRGQHVRDQSQGQGQYLRHQIQGQCSCLLKKI